MKILWLYKYDVRYNFDHFLHIDVAISLNKVSNVEVKVWGVNMDQGCPDLCHSICNGTQTLEQIHKTFPFDVVIANTKSRCFEYYLPARAMGNVSGEQKNGEWLPSDFNTFPTKRIMIEEDFHYEESNEWYIDKKFDIVLQRHYSNAVRGNEMGGIKHKFFPFSTDTNVFKDNKSGRNNYIGFAGAINNTYYEFRRKMSKLLLKSKRPILLAEPQSPILHDKAYLENLNLYIAHLSGASVFQILPAKTFEIIASGSVLLTNDNPATGMHLVFPKDCYVGYKEDGSDIIEKATRLINDVKYRKGIRDNATAHLLDNHTHEIRHQELLDIIEKIKGD